MGFYIFKLKFSVRQQLLINKARSIWAYFLVLLALVFGIRFLIQWNNNPMAIATPFIYIEPITSYFRFQHSAEVKDWHDYEVIKQEALRKGPGEQGKAVHLTDDEKIKNEEILKEFNHNGLVSDKIARDRAIKDTRPEMCQQKKYLADLPSVSVIIPFFNERLSTLTRTVHSVFNRSPPELLKEVILVNDKSDMEDTYGPLEEYAREHFDLKKFKILVMPKRSGLMWGRLAGARAASGDVLVFMDCHNEANVNWLPPLIEPIAKNYRVCALPMVDIIDSSTYKYYSDGNDVVGIFDWSLTYRFVPIRPGVRITKEDPYPNPIMMGCVFAISAKFFWELGGYDSGLDIWGGEQFELGFKVWLCGGEQLNVPCSRVGHLYRPRPFTKSENHGDYVLKNFKRVAEVWMDEYKQHVHNHYGERWEKIEAGDVSYMVGLREKLQCKPFSYMLDAVAPDVLDCFPLVEPPSFASGGIQSDAHPDLCIDTLGVAHAQPVGLYPCQGKLESPGYRQNYRLRPHRNLYVDGSGSECLDFNNGQILLYTCKFKQLNQYFRYDLDTKQIFCGRKRDQMCIDMDAEKRTIFAMKCDESKNTQKWNWGFVNETMLRNWADYGKPILDPLEIEDFAKK